MFLLSFCLIIFPSVNPFGKTTEQKELYTPSSGKLGVKLGFHFSAFVGLLILSWLIVSEYCLFFSFLLPSFCFPLIVIVAVIFRTLRSLPPESTDALPYLEPEEKDLLLVPHAEVENVKSIFTGGQNNHTPDYQRVEQSDSETGVNSNSSADFPAPSQAKEISPGPIGALKEGSVDGAVAYEVAGSKDNWIDRNPPSIILQKRRADEM